MILLKDVKKVSHLSAATNFLTARIFADSFKKYSLWSYLIRALQPHTFGGKELRESEIFHDVCPFPILQIISSQFFKARIVFHLICKLPFLIRAWAQASSSWKPSLTTLSKVMSWVCEWVCVCMQVYTALACSLTPFRFPRLLIISWNHFAYFLPSLSIACLTSRKDKLCMNRELSVLSWL